MRFSKILLWHQDSTDGNTENEYSDSAAKQSSAEALASESHPLVAYLAIQCNRMQAA